MSNKVNSRVLSERFLGCNEKFYKSQLLQVGDLWKIVILEQKTEDKKIEDFENESRIIKVDKIRAKSDKKTDNDKIEKYLETNKLSPLEALVTVEKKVKNKITTQTKIEEDLGIEVERYLQEERVNEKIKIVRLKTEVSYDVVAEIPVYCKLLPNQFRKFVINYLNSNNNGKTK